MKTYTDPESLKNKGGAKLLLRKRMQFLIAMLDADVPQPVINKACDVVYKAITYYKQKTLEKEIQKNFPYRITVRRKLNVKRRYKYAAGDETPHEAKYLRECKRLDVDPE